jgi:hypothetical protein
LKYCFEIRQFINVVFRVSIAFSRGVVSIFPFYPYMSRLHQNFDSPIPSGGFRSAGGSRGFAMVLALMLMGFILVLVLSLSLFIQVSTKSSALQIQTLEARMNALLGLQVAMGRLQQAAGPDQRSTGVADLAARNPGGDRVGVGVEPSNPAYPAGSDRGLSAVNPGTRYWTGVWVNAQADEDAVYTAAPVPRLLTWLVSGNEDGLDFDPDLGLNALGNARRFDVGGGREAVLLVGPGTTGQSVRPDEWYANFGLSSVESGDLEDREDRFVVAPLVDFEASGSDGAFAYWVGDEGVKARYNLSDPSAWGEPEDLAGALAPLRMGVELTTASDLAQPSAASSLASFSNTPDFRYDSYPFPGNRSPDVLRTLPTVGSLSQAELIHFDDPAAVDERLKRRFHVLSTESSGILSNSRAGGLRRDLNLAMENASVFANIFSDDTILPPGVSPDAGPTWSGLRRAYQLADRLSSAVTVEDAGAAGVGLVMTELRLLFKLFPDRVTGTWKLRVSLAIGLANPYTVPLETDGLHLALDRAGRSATGNDYTRFGRDSDPPTGWGHWWVWALSDGAPEDAQANRITSFKVIDGPSESDSGYSGWTLTSSDTVFAIPPARWEPGEMKLFAVADQDQTVSTTSPSEISLEERSIPPLESHYFSYDTGEALPATDTVDTVYDAWLQLNRSHAGWGGRWYPAGFSFALYPRDQSPANTANPAPLTRADIVTFYTAAPVVPNTTGNAFDPAIFAGVLHLYLALPHEDTRLIDDRRPYPFRLFLDHNLRAGFHPPSPFLGTDHLLSQFPYSGQRVTAASRYTEGPLLSGVWPWGGSFSDASETAWATLVLYDLPFRANPAEPPFVSLAQLQHVDLTADDESAFVGHQKGLAVGNSIYSPLVPRDQSVVTRLADGYLPDRQIRFFDMSYLLNTALFDDYFFSSYPGSGFNGKLPNPRYVLDDPAAMAPASGDNAAGTGPAAGLTVDGAFNVNSTEVEAWAAVLGSTLGKAVGSDNPGKGAAFPRSLRQPRSAEEAARGDRQDAYAGSRRLTDEEVRRLAWEMVRQVRQRGPFLTLGQFVNRVLIPADAGSNPDEPPASFGLSGALQAAIDAAGLNELPGLVSDWVAPRLTDEDGLNNPFWADAATDYPALLAADGANLRPLQGNRSAGIPGVLLQADVLQSLAPILSARSDTFRIRSYGEAIGLTGEVEARAWCEAVVQRRVDYVDPSDPPGASPDSLQPVNRDFGRRFEIVELRWLSADEI